MNGATAQLPRLLALVPYLLTRPGARLSEVARTFGVSERQLTDDLNLIYMCGLPGYYPGDLIEVDITGDYVTVSNADTIARPLRLTGDEALALIVGLRMLADLPGVADTDAVERALAKLESAAGQAAASSAAAVVVDVEAEGTALDLIKKALSERRRLHLKYYVPGRDETTERDVDPMRIAVADGRSYLEAWCHRAEAVRMFRLDRIAEVQVLDVAADVPPQAQPRDLDGGLFQPSPGDAVVTLALQPEAAWVSEYYPCESVDEASDGGLVVQLRTADTRWVRRLMLRLGPAARVLEPGSLAEEVRADAAAALAGYATSTSV
jgi:proteasome accessory factor C